MPPLSAIILSAGLSSRMKAFKPMLKCGNQMMIERNVDLLRSTGIADIVVVTGHNHHLLEPVIEKLGAKPAFNPDYRKGMLSSIQKGVAQINPESSGFFLLPVDIPAIRPSTVRALITAFNPDAPKSIMPYFGGTPGHPPLIPSGLKSQILRLSSDESLRDVLFNNKNPMKKITTYDRGILMDADTPEAFRAICDKVALGNIPDKEECLELINHHLPDDEPIRKHLADVAMTAVKLAGAVTEPLDCHLVIAASLLHDIKRKEKKHPEKGAELLQKLGFFRVADIVAQHMDLKVQSIGRSICENEIVYFADKLCNGKGLDLNYHKRFADSLKKSPWAMTSISRRYENTQAIQARVEASAGKPLAQIFES